MGVLVFYRALAIGPTTVVSPIAAGGVAVPVLVGALGGETPSAVVGVGLMAAVGGMLSCRWRTARIPRMSRSPAQDASHS